VADAAMVTEENLRLLGDNPFVTRLPFSYNEASRVVRQAVSQGSWEKAGTLNETPSTPKRPVAHYSITEKTVTVYGREYRAVVVHSTAHDKRRLKRINREIQKSQKTLQKLIAEESKREYFCRPDAEAAAYCLQQSDTDLHRITICLTEKLLYARGRPPKNAPRKVSSVRYFLAAQVEEKTEQIQCRCEEAGCFVLLTNVPFQGEKSRSGVELLRAYKDQYGIERNYSFLKDPLIVNDLFLKKPERVEVLGAILLIALLIWNLIEYVLRQHVDKENVDLPGWDNKPTRRPTAFMMSTKFFGVQVIKVGPNYHLLNPLTDVQKLYLEALDMSEQDLLFPLREIGCN
jgi:transposase